MAPRSVDPRLALLAFAGITLVRVALFAHWGLIADEAWYLAWSERLALGYYDQPPAIAWLLRGAVSVFGSSEIAIRAIPLACGVAIPALLYREAGDRALWLMWCGLLPPIGWLTGFATPDAPLLACWALGLAGALRGGRGWVVAGLAAGLAFQCKHTGALLFPLLLLGSPGAARTREAWLGGALALALALPNLAWNASHEWVTVRFQLGEGLLHPVTPGPLGGVLQIAGQLLVATPILGLCGYAWAVLRARSEDPVARLLWWSSAPLLGLFALAGCFAPGEAHWAAPAWIGLGLGLSREAGRWRRAAWSGLGLGAVLVALVAAHSLRPLVPLRADPATRLTEGPVLGGLVARIAATADEAGVPRVVYTERYQEAGFIQHYADIPATVHPGCGRPGQQGLWGDPTPAAGRALFVRPRTGGPPDCLRQRWTIARGPIRLNGVDAQGRSIGPWELFELEAR